MTYFFKIQFLRFRRLLIELGFNIPVTFCIFPLIVIALFKLLYIQTEFADYIILLFTFVTLSKLSNFRRNSFLRQVFSRSNHIRIRIIENLLIAVPIAFLMFFFGTTFLCLIPLALAIPLVFLKSNNYFSRAIPTPFTKNPFEFIVGLRSNILILLIILALIIIGVWVGNYNLSAVCLFALFIIFMTFYVPIENEFFTWIHIQKPEEFIIKKSITAVKQSLTITLVPVLVLLYFFKSNYEITLLILLIGIALVLLALLIKYSQYPNSFNITNVLLMILSIGLPFFLIITLPYFYYKAQQNLILHLND